MGVMSSLVVREIPAMNGRFAVLITFVIPVAASNNHVAKGIPVMEIWSAAPMEIATPADIIPPARGIDAMRATTLMKWMKSATH